MESGIRKQARPIWYFSQALVAFFLLGAEFLVFFLDRVIDGRSMTQLTGRAIHWYAAVFHWLVTIAIWGAYALYLFCWSKNKAHSSELINFRIDKRVVLLVIAAVFLAIIDAIIGNKLYGDTLPQILREYRGFRNLYNNKAFIVSIFQNIYYLFECLLVVIMVMLFQKSGEEWFKVKKFPWGSIGLVLTWGAIHFLSHPEGALSTTIWAILPGIFYIIGRKSFYPVYAILILAFIV